MWSIIFGMTTAGVLLGRFSDLSIGAILLLLVPWAPC